MARLFATLVLLLPSLALGGPIEQAYAAFSRGREAAAAGELPAAETAYREALAHAPGWILPDLELAELALRRREGLLTARVALEAQALRVHENPRLFRLLGALAAAQDDRAAAVPRWRRSLELAPDQPALREELALALDALGKAGEAAAEWRLLLARDPRSVTLQTRLAESLEAAGQKGEARLAYEAAVALEPDKALPLRRLARFLDRIGEAAAAAEAHAKADRLEGRAPAGRKLRPLRPSKW